METTDESSKIIQITIFDPAGVIVFHRSFNEHAININLFSAFTSAILAFAKEMGQELMAISLEDITYYMQTRGHYTVVLGVDSDIHDPFAKAIFQLIQDSPYYRQLEEMAPFNTIAGLPELDCYLGELLDNQELTRKYIFGEGNDRQMRDDGC